MIIKKIKLDSRTLLAAKNSVAMLVIKGVSIVISFLYVPLLISQLTKTNYGIWLTLSSLVSWCSFLDIGLGHGLRNLLAKSITEGDSGRMKDLVGTTYASMLCLALTAIILVLITFPFFNWATILNAPASYNNELTLLAIIATVCFLLNFVLNIIGSILYSIQKPAYSSFVTVLSQFVAFLIIYFLSLTGRSYSLIVYGSIISIVPLCVLLLYTVILFKTKLSFLSFGLRNVKQSLVRPLFQLGVKFFFIELTAVLLFQTNNIIIAQICGSEMVADYNVGYKYISIISMIYAILITPIWSASTDAYFRGDILWIRNTLTRLKLIWSVFVVCGFLLIIFSKFVYTKWIGDNISIDYLMLSLLLFYFVCNMWCGLHCRVINGIGKVKLQFYFTLIESLIHIPLAVILGFCFGIYGILISMCFMTFVNAIWEPIQINKLLNQNAKGIWNQ